MNSKCDTTLNTVPVGARARICRINGGKEIARRLMGLGLRVGSEINVLQHRGKGVVVANAGNRVALGGAIAGKLLMCPIISD
ncbi:MAG: ferrous iron transport protein A [Candidatus Sedimenticola sp. (ex Thyasira tokunagai)]